MEAISNKEINNIIESIEKGLGVKESVEITSKHTTEKFYQLVSKAQLRFLRHIRACHSSGEILTLEYISKRDIRNIKQQVECYLEC